MNSATEGRRASVALSRRTFVKGLTAAGACAGLGTWRTRALAQEVTRQPPTVLTGTKFELRIGEQPVNITGSRHTAFCVNGSLPAPTLRWREGDRVALRVSNAIAIVMLFITGYAYGRVTGWRPWVVGISMVFLGSALVGLTMALGG